MDKVFLICLALLIPAFAVADQKQINSRYTVKDKEGKPAWEIIFEKQRATVWASISKVETDAEKKKREAREIAAAQIAGPDSLSKSGLIVGGSRPGWLRIEKKTWSDMNTVLGSFLGMVERAKLKKIEEDFEQGIKPPRSLEGRVFKFIQRKGNYYFASPWGSDYSHLSPEEVLSLKTVISSLDQYYSQSLKPKI